MASLAIREFFHYKELSIDRTHCLGYGTYGAVYKAKCDQLPCAAKIIHQVIGLDPMANDPGADIMMRFQQEMSLLERIQHPNIVQYFGMATDPESRLPLLLMELLDESLTEMLERSQRAIAYCVQVDICHDIALAIAYLHSNKIIHHNLTSNNVLIMAGRRAKVTDFSMSSLVGGLRTMHPGIREYMPPEALMEPPRYTPKVDCFSEGVIMIQICTRLRPKPGPRFAPDSRSPTGTAKAPVPEVGRRKNHIDLISPTHPLLPIALDCLSDRDIERPSSEELCKQLAGLKKTKKYRESIERFDKGEQQQSETCTWGLRGVEVCGEVTVVVYSSHHQQVTWSGYGLRLHIPKDSLPVGMEQCTINIKASLAGQYEFPENSHPVSAVFWLHCEDVHKFTKPITVEIQHCATVVSHNLDFIRAVCSQKQLPYAFKQLPGGNFASHSSYGVIELNSFSGVGVIENGADNRTYLASVLYNSQRIQSEMEICIVVTWNIKAHYTAMRSHDHFKNAELVTDQPIRFESDRVKFIISNMPGGWTVTSLNSSVILKTDVDSFIPGRTSWIPYCNFIAEYSDDVSVIKFCSLVCDVDIEGAMPPHNKFKIRIPHGAHQYVASLDQHLRLTQLETRLTDDNHATLQRQLSIHAAKWREIGTYLGFKQGELDNIQSSVLPSTDFTTRCLSDMLAKWLEWAPGDGRGSTSFATLETLKRALKQADLGVTAHDLNLQIQ